MKEALLPFLILLICLGCLALPPQACSAAVQVEEMTRSPSLSSLHWLDLGAIDAKPPQTAALSEFSPREGQGLSP